MPTTTELLWRHERPLPPRPGRRPRHRLDDVVAAAVAVADERGSGFGLRDVARALELGVMSLYSYVADRDQLLDLMVDACHAAMASRPVAGRGWADAVRVVAEDNLALLRAHPWLGDHGAERAVLGPGTIAKYERELAAFEPLPLEDLERDACLTLVLDLVRACARSMALAEQERAREPHEQWWAREGAVLAQLDLAGRYPLATRVGQAAGAYHGAAGDAAHAFRFALDRVVAAVAELAAGR